MEHLFTYLDYRTYLRDWFESNKSRNSIISYRYMGNKIGLDASFLVKVFQGQLHISTKSIHRIAEFLKFEKKEREYFELLVLFNKSKKNSETQLLFEKLLSFRSPDARIIDSAKFDFFSNWYNIAIYELLRFYKFDGDYKRLANTVQPTITVTQARDSIALLQRLELISMDTNGKIKVHDINLSTGEKWFSSAVHKFQKEAISLSDGALDLLPKEQRDISTVTVSLSDETFSAIRERIKAMRRELLEIAKNDTNVDAVYQINFQVFPVSKREKKEE